MTHPWRKNNITGADKARMRAAKKYRDDPEAVLAPRRRARKTHKSDIHLDAHRRWLGMPEPTRPCPDVCELCGDPPGKNRLALDHDHATGKFRGWLCMKCNTALGMLKDRIDLLHKAIAYLTDNS